ncbi:MAG: WYL domain-containing protein [Micrococcales bacterium]|nr:WYL domain-containing protein [Micrococcales bacterium]
MSTQAAAKTERLLNLVICLLHTRRPLLKGQVRRAVPQYDQVSDEAFDRMFERDKDELRALGIPLISAVADPFFGDDVAYHIDRREYALPQISFTPAESAALSLAARTWTHATLAGAGAEALRKLAAVGVEPDAGPSGATLSLEPRVPAVEPAFEAVRAAVVQTYPITFGYQRSGGASTCRHVQPWGIASWHGRWYLTGFDTDRAGSRVFRLGRITSPVKADGHPGSYVVPADHDPRRAIRFAADSSGPERERIARVTVRAGRAHALRRRALDAESNHPGLWDEIRISFTDGGRLIDELCWYGPDVCVLEPEDVRAGVVARLRSAARQDS